MRSVNEILELNGGLYSLRHGPIVVPGANEWYMPLEIGLVGLVGPGKRGPQVQVRHTITKDRKVLSDPAVQFEVYGEEPKWDPIRLTTSQPGTIIDCGGMFPLKRSCLRPAASVYLLDFCEKWDINIREQGYIERAAALTKTKSYELGLKRFAGGEWIMTGKHYATREEAITAGPYVYALDEGDTVEGFPSPCSVDSQLPPGISPLAGVLISNLTPWEKIK